MSEAVRNANSMKINATSKMLFVNDDICDFCRTRFMVRTFNGNTRIDCEFKRRSSFAMVELFIYIQFQ